MSWTSAARHIAGTSPNTTGENFLKELEHAGIIYHYAGDSLGGRPKDPACYISGEIPPDSSDYLHLVDYPAVMEKVFFQSGIARLLEFAEDRRVAVMCSEEDPAKCHRHHLIGRYLTKQGVKVIHIRGDGNLIGDQYLPNLIEEPPAQQLNLF